MTPETPKPGSSSAAGPMLVLLTGACFTGVMIYLLIGDLRFTFAGVPVRAEAEPRWDHTFLSFTDAGGQKREATIDGRLVNGIVNIRYLPDDPERVRLEEDVHPALLWGMFWLVLGLAVTGFGVLLTWGRRPKHTRTWGRGRPSEW